MPNFGVNDNDRRTSEAMERIWADRRKEQVMSEVKPFEQHEIDAIVREEREFNDVGGCSACDVARFVATIDHWRQRAEQAEADRKVIGGYLEQVLGNMMQSTGHERDEWKKSAHPLLAAALGRAK